MDERQHGGACAAEAVMNAIMHRDYEVSNAPVQIDRLGHRVLAVDLDPQANLTAAFLDDALLARLWHEDAAADDELEPDLFGLGPFGHDAGTVAESVEPLLDQTGDVKFFEPIAVSSRLSLVPGDLELSRFED